MDIRKRKPRIINLKKKVKVRVERYDTPVVHVDEPIVAPPRIIDQAQCFKCGGGNEDNLRCADCEAKHQEIVARLDARPQSKVEKVPVQWVKSKEIRNGIVITNYMTKEEAQMMGQNING